MYRVIIVKSAVEDLRHATGWYNRQRKGLGKQLLKRIREKGLLLREYPFIYQVRYQNIRVAPVEQFPFLIHYQVDKRNLSVVIYAILHSSRNPEIWFRRLK